MKIMTFKVLPTYQRVNKNYRMIQQRNLYTQKKIRCQSWIRAKKSKFSIAPYRHIDVGVASLLEINIFMLKYINMSYVAWLTAKLTK